MNKVGKKRLTRGQRYINVTTKFELLFKAIFIYVVSGEEKFSVYKVSRRIWMRDFFFQYFSVCVFLFLLFILLWVENKSERVTWSACYFMTEWFAPRFKSLMPRNHKYRERGKGLNRSLYSSLGTRARNKR